MRPFLVPEERSPRPVGDAPRFSVLIPAYQAAGFIGDALASVFAQTFAPDEVIVCDDGSTDDLDRALAPFRDRITLLHQSHAGQAAAKNRAATAASGDFVVILDADDTWQPQRLEAMSELAILRPDLDILNTDAYFESNGETLGRFGDRNPFETREQRHGILERCFIFGHAAIRRERYLEAGGFDPRVTVADDWHFWMRLILSGSRAGTVDEPLARYRLRQGSVTDDRVASLWSRVRALELVRDHQPLSPDERRVLAGSLVRHRRRALLAEAKLSLAAANPGARRRALGVALGRGFGLRTRALALGAAVAPRFAGHRLRPDELDAGISRAARPSDNGTTASA